MNELAVHAQEQRREFHMLRLTDAVLIPCRMVEHDKRARIASQRTKHGRDGSDLWPCGECLKLGENRPRHVRRNVVQAEMKEGRSVGHGPFDRDRYIAALPEHSQFEWRVD